MPPPSKVSKFVLILLVLLAASEFVVRGPVRFLRAVDFNDFLAPYIQSKALVKGMDPYSPHVLVELWPSTAHRPIFIASDLDEGSLVTRRGIPTAYPLSCLLLLAPLTVLPWPVAHVAWAIINVGLTLLLIWTLLASARFQKAGWRAYVFVAFALALAPLQTGVATGSIAIATVALCGIALARDQRSMVLAGVLFGLAICLKPQIGLPFLAYFLLRRHWRLCGIAAAVVATAFLVAITRLAMSGTPWLQNYRTDNRILLSSGILSDFTERNPIRFGLINLQVLFYAIFQHANAANVLAVATSAALFGIWIWLVLRRDSHDVLLPMSTLLVLSLFPIYHRLYDAWILVFPLCWSLKQFAGADRKFARAAFFLLLPFLVPGGSALEQLQANYQIPEAISQSWYWSAIVMPHQIWFLLLLSLLLLARMAVLLPDDPAEQI